MTRFNRSAACLLALLVLLIYAAPFTAFADDAPTLYINSPVGINFEGKCEEKKLVLSGYVDNKFSNFLAGACALEYDPSLLSINTVTGVQKEGDFKILKSRADNTKGNFSMEFAYLNKDGNKLASGNTQTKFVTLVFDLVGNGSMSSVSEDSVKLSEDNTYFIDLGTCFRENGALTVYDIDIEDALKKMNTKTLGNKGATSAVTDFNNPFNIKVTGVTVTPASSSLDVGKTLTLKATVSPENATKKTVKWTSSDPSIATVSQDGVVTGVKKGEVTITVTTDDGGKTASAKISVVGAPSTSSVTGITLSPTSSTLTVGKTLTLKATISPSNASNKNIEWSSSDPSVATVSANGVVTGVKAGTATITARTSDGGFTATAGITVQNASAPGTRTEDETRNNLIIASITVMIGAVLVVVQGIKIYKAWKKTS